MRFLLVSSLAGTCLLLTACEEDMRAPPPPADARITDSTTFPPPPRDGSMDASSDGAMDSAADTMADASIPPGCFEAGPGTGTTADVLVGGETFPFAVTRSFATWDLARCDSTQDLVIGLTEGSCVAAIGTQLLFSLERDAINVGITVGVNTLVAEPDDLGLKVRFRSVGAGGIAEVWGSCAGASGTVTFAELDALLGSQLTADYDLILTDCEEPFDAADIAVTGSFDLPLEFSFEMVCL